MVSPISFAILRNICLGQNSYRFRIQGGICCPLCKLQKYTRITSKSPPSISGLDKQFHIGVQEELLNIIYGDIWNMELGLWIIDLGQ